MPILTINQSLLNYWQLFNTNKPPKNGCLTSINHYKPWSTPVFLWLFLASLYTTMAINWHDSAAQETLLQQLPSVVPRDRRDICMDSLHAAWAMREIDHYNFHQPSLMIIYHELSGMVTMIIQYYPVITANWLTSIWGYSQTAWWGESCQWTISHHSWEALVPRKASEQHAHWLPKKPKLCRYKSHQQFSSLHLWDVNKLLSLIKVFFVLDLRSRVWNCDWAILGHPTCKIKKQPR